MYECATLKLKVWVCEFSLYTNVYVKSRVCHSCTNGKFYPGRLGIISLIALSAKCACVSFLFFFFLLTHYYKLNERRGCASQNGQDLNKPTIQLSAVINWHSSGITHDSLTIQEKKKKKLYFLFTKKAQGVNC